ncbi:MAG TPA: lysophospholipid acyltransferase family protein [Chthonomonadales bacterium]|nr:lysophospholipid acyltransferase family protein [Chthonomonadales bacterium]
MPVVSGHASRGVSGAPAPSRTSLLYRVCRNAAHVLFRLTGRVRIIGHENVPESGPLIVACNHVSYLDPPLVGSSIHRECRFMARASLFRNRLFGGFISRIGAYPMDRDKPTRDMVRQTLRFLEQGYIVVMFPEGTRSSNGQLGPGESGIALFVRQSGAPVLPAAVIGPERMLPRSSRFPRPARLTVILGRPIYITPDTPRADIVRAIMRAIAELLTEHGAPAIAAEDRAPEEPAPTAGP